MHKAAGWLIGGVIVGAMAYWGLQAVTGDPAAVEVGSFDAGDLADLYERLDDIELSSATRRREQAELAARIASLEEDVGRLADALARVNAPTPDATLPQAVADARVAGAVVPPVNGSVAPPSLSGIEVGPEGYVVYEVTGTTEGSVWGTDVYTDDSTIGAAAVHAGILEPDETGSVIVWVFPGQESYVGSARYGVESRDFGRWNRSYSLQRM